jgi:hypothetical protein
MMRMTWLVLSLLAACGLSNAAPGMQVRLPEGSDSRDIVQLGTLHPPQATALRLGEVLIDATLKLSENRNWSSVGCICGPDGALVIGEAGEILRARPGADTLERMAPSGLLLAARWMALTGDTIEVSDGKSLQVLDAATGWHYRELHPDQGWQDAKIDAHGRAGAVLLLASRTEGPVKSPTPRRTFFAVESMDAATGSRDTLAIFPGSVEFRALAETEQASLVLPGSRVPFTSTLHARARGDRIVVLDGLERLWILSDSGKFIRRLDPSMPRRKVTEASRAHYKATHSLQAAMVGSADDSLPFFDRLELDEDGGIWLETFDDTGSIQKWVRLNEHGGITASIELPPELRVIQFNADRLLTSTAETPKVQRIRAYTLVRRGTHN